MIIATGSRMMVISWEVFSEIVRFPAAWKNTVEG